MFFRSVVLKQVQFSFKITGMPESVFHCKDTIPINFSVALLTEELCPERKMVVTVNITDTHILE